MQRKIMQKARLSELVQRKSDDGIKKSKVYKDLAGLLGKSVRRIQDYVRFQGVLHIECEDMEKMYNYFGELSTDDAAQTNSEAH